MKRVLLILFAVILVLGTITGAYTYLYGDAQDPRRLRGRAALGDVEAQFSLAQKLAEGEGVAENDAQALKWFQEAAEKGHPRAAMTMSRLYFTGDGVGADKEKGAQWMLRAAQAGDSHAQALMGMLFLGGVGVPHDPRAALGWLGRSREEEAIKLYGTMKAEIAAIDALPAAIREDRMVDYFEKKRAAFERMVERSIDKMAGKDKATQNEGEQNGR